MAAKRKKKVPASRAKLKPKRKPPRRTKPDKLRGRSIGKASASRPAPKHKKKKQSPQKKRVRASAPAKRRSAKKSIRKKPVKRSIRPAKRKRPVKRPIRPAKRKQPTKRRRVQVPRSPVPPRRRAGRLERPRKPRAAANRIPLKQLEAERPQLKAFVERLIVRPWSGNTRTVLNKNHTIDSEAKIARPLKMEASDFVFQLEQVYHLIVSQFPSLHGTWLKLGAIFNRESEKWLTYELPIFRGKEAVIMNYATTIENAAPYWVDFRSMIGKVLSSYLTPDRRGRQRPTYSLTHVLIRLHRGVNPPLY